MKNKYTLEIVVSLILIGLLILIINPSDIFMPTMAHMMLAGFAVIVFGFFAGLVLKEKTKDEREEKHRGLAGRAAFLAGSSILIIGMVSQTLKDSIDPWLVASLVVMILVKLTTRIYNDLNK